VQVADLAGGSLIALAGLLMAVIQRGASGRGQMVDVSMFDGSLSLATMVAAGVTAGLEEPRPGGMTLNGRYPCYGLYATADGAWMSLGALEPKFWQNFCAAVERPDLAAGQFGGQAEKDQMAALFKGRDLDLKEALAGELAAERGMVETEGPEQGLLACPLRLSGAANLATTRAPGLGEHSRSVLAEAGFDPDEIDRLQAAGVVGAR
jgi:crotonobetainyl-CoA:carnitine CoA-transferase CaiB-like acyl-CoA transferase